MFFQNEKEKSLFGCAHLMKLHFEKRKQKPLKNDDINSHNKSFLYFSFYCTVKAKQERN